MLTQTPDDKLRELSKYDRIAIYLFRRVTSKYPADPLPNEMAFDLDDVRAAMRQAVDDGMIDKVVDNVADVKYTYDARRAFPAEIEQCGPITWLQRGKGLYKFKRTRRPNIILLSDTDPKAPLLETEVDVTPGFIQALLGNDEQAVFTRVRNAGLISKFLGFMAYPIQGHLRTTVNYGQVEIDEVQAGMDKSNPTIVPISGKGGQDKLSWSQVLNLNTYGLEKSPVPGLPIRSLGLWRDSSNAIWIVEFSPHTDIDQIEIVAMRRFVFRLG